MPGAAADFLYITPSQPHPSSRAHDACLPPSLRPSLPHSLRLLPRFLRGCPCRVQIRKSIRLKYLARIEAFIDSPGQQEYFELVFVQVSEGASAGREVD